MAQFSRPASDISDGAWAPVGEVDIYATIDETVAADADYAESATSDTTFEVGMSNLGEAQSGTWTVRVRGRTDGFASNPNMTVVLKQDGVTIRSEGIAFLGTLSTITFTLSAPEIAALTLTDGEYQDLSIAVTCATLNKGEIARVTWLELEAPDVLPRRSSRLPLCGVS